MSAPRLHRNPVLRPERVTLLAVVAALELVACHEPVPPSQEGSSSDESDSGIDTETTACPSVDGPGRLHSGPITADEQWRAEDGPHRVEGLLSITSGATVTIEACTEVRMAAAASIEVGEPFGAVASQLVADGEPGREIVITRDGGAPWASLTVFAPGLATLRHVQIDGGGSDEFREQASIVVYGTGLLESVPPLWVEDVQVSGSAGPGVLLLGAAAFDDRSHGLTITASGSATRPFPLVLGEHGLDSIPEGDYTGNAVDEILVREDAPDGVAGLQRDTTLRDLGVPYRIGDVLGEDLRIGASGMPLVTLRAEPGVHLRFSPDSGLRVVSDFDGPRGRIELLGTDEEPVVLESAADVPQAGDWPGLYFESPMADSRIEHAVIAHAGGHCSCSLVSCSPVDTYDAAIVLDGRPPSAFVRDTTIVHSGGHGVLRAWEGADDLDFVDGNVFEDLAGCRQTVPMLPDTVCPDPAYACDATKSR